MAKRPRRDSQVAAGSAPIFAALHRAVHRIQQAVNESDLDVTHPEAVVLALLATSGETTMGKIHRSFGFRKSTVTNVVDRLVERGLVERDADIYDGRSWIVRLTPRGIVVGHRVLQVFREVEPIVRQILASRE
jgi:DNA-binding MarR family transcriptional regulator